MPIKDITALNIVRLTFHRNTTRPAKNSDTETCINVGNASTTIEKWLLSTPSAKKERIRARLCRLERVCVTLRYLRAHCCSNVASRAQVTLITKLENQSELTQTANVGGENGGGEAGRELEILDRFGSAIVA